MSVARMETPTIRRPASPWSALSSQCSFALSCKLGISIQAGCVVENDRQRRTSRPPVSAFAVKPPQFPSSFSSQRRGTNPSLGALKFRVMHFYDERWRGSRRPDGWRLSLLGAFSDKLSNYLKTARSCLFRSLLLGKVSHRQSLTGGEMGQTWQTL